MKRGEPPKRKTPLKRSTSPLKRSPLRPKRRSEPGLASARKAVFARATGSCEANWDGCTRVAVHAHHMLRRSQGGEHTAENLLAVCHHCHESIHRNPELAYQRGHLRRRKAD